MRAIDSMIKTEIAKARELFLYELLGKYGDELPKNIHEDMRVYAKDLETEVLRLKKKNFKPNLNT